MAEDEGSSPRVRGKLDDDPPLGRAPGLIPARAGKTVAGILGSSGRTAHPRACGENTINQDLGESKSGSSPRVRGKLVPGPAKGSRTGLIPARAGKTVLLRPNRSGSGAHPRACGENALGFDEGGGHEGSSPRVRGKQRNHVTRDGGRRLIPARAGKTFHSCRRNGHAWAHPRACGENSARELPWFGSVGSSPRVRGKQPPLDVREPAGRLIPARAGKTILLFLSVSAAAAHPRACGENSIWVFLTGFLAGSSPRVRGKRADRCAGQPRVGLIPARAGKTGRRPRPRRAWSAHPRACGENSIGAGLSQSSHGSSPRVRGKPC